MIDGRSITRTTTGQVSPIRLKAAGFERRPSHHLVPPAVSLFLSRSKDQELAANVVACASCMLARSANFAAMPCPGQEVLTA